MSVRYVLDGAIATLTIDGRGERNLMTTETGEVLNARLAEFDEQPAAVACILRGAGDEHFSAGLENAKGSKRAEAVDAFFNPRPFRSAGPTASARRESVYRPSKPVIAAIAGDCLGEALVFVGQASDVRVAGESARFGFPQHDGLGSLLVRSRLQHQIPYAPLMSMILTGEPIDAHEAFRIGLVTQVVPDAEVFAQAQDIARQVDQLPPFTVRMEKGAILACEHLNAADAVYFGWAYDCMTHRHPDGFEGVSSWIEKRQPHFWRFEQEE
jgi:enoyl-CoA hydratase/carnithine racemase